MNRFDILSRALDYIESNIEQEIEIKNIARYAYCSLSSLQKLFRYTFDYSVKEYIIKRKLTLAAKEISSSDRTILEIAYKYGYNSPENFNRAFKKLWGVTPLKFRNQSQFIEIFPKLYIEKHSNCYDYHKDVAILYDYLKDNPSLKIMCFDVVGLMEINTIARAAGDKAIIEAVNRIVSCKEENQPLFRLGGDEFALLIKDQDFAYCVEIEEKIMLMNGKCFEYENYSIPLIIRVWISTNSLFQSEHELSEKLIYNVKHAWEQS